MNNKIVQDIKKSYKELKIQHNKKVVNSYINAGFVNNFRGNLLVQIESLNPFTKDKIKKTK